jgi:hypothetical protein
MERVGFGRSVFGFDVRRNGEADLFGDRRLVQAVDCFVGEPFAGSNAGKLEASQVGSILMGKREIPCA